MAPTKKRRRGHDRGRVLVDLAVAMADGATTFSDLRAWRTSPSLFGEVASVATTWRTLEAVDEAALAGIAGPGRRPASRRGRRGWTPGSM